jgi:hypothetical protein
MVYVVLDEPLPCIAVVGTLQLVRNAIDLTHRLLNPGPCSQRRGQKVASVLTGKPVPAGP